MGKKINLLYFCSDYQIGLTQAQTEQIENLVKETSLNLHCISSENEQESGLHSRVKATGVKISIIRDLDVHENFKELANQIKEIIIDNEITHVNIQNNWQLALLGYVKLTCSRKFKLIYTIHGYRHNHPFKALIAIGAIGLGLMVLTDRVISMSDYVTRKFFFLKYKTDRFFYLMNKPQYNKTENVIPTDKLRLVFPAQFRRGKNQQILIKSIAKYIKHTGDSSIELHLPGDGPLLMDMKKLASNLNIENNVIFYGKIPLDDVIKLYEKTNIALCSSNVETYGRCIAEPFMLGRCVITHKTGVAGDIIRHGINGYYFKSEDDLVDILIDLHKNPSQIKDIANQAFIDRKVFFTPNVMKSYIESLNKA